MALFDLFRGPADPLTEQDENESKDLALHVRQCAKRYQSLLNKTSRLEMLMWVLIALLIATRVIDLEKVAQLI